MQVVWGPHLELAFDVLVGLSPLPVGSLLTLRSVRIELLGHSFGIGKLVLKKHHI